MNRAEYMNCLANQLRRLPKEDFDKAMEYFIEYFDEAGAENEQQAIDDLGTPQMAADQIIMDMAIRNADEPAKGVKRGLSAIWIGILAVFAAPIALPLALCLAAAAFCIVLAVVLVILSVVLAAVVFIASAILGVFGGVYLLFVSPAGGIATLGLSFSCLGIGILVGYGCIKLWRVFLKGMAKTFGKIVKGGRRHEK